MKLQIKLLNKKKTTQLFWNEVAVSFVTITIFTRTHIIFITHFLSSNNLVDFYILAVFHSVTNIPRNQCLNYLYAGILLKYVHLLWCKQGDIKHCGYQIHLKKLAVSESSNLTRLQSRQKIQTCSSCHWKRTALPSVNM